MGKDEVHIPFVGPKVERLLLWRDPKETGIVVGGATAAYMALYHSPYPLLSILLYVLALASTVFLIWCQVGAVVHKTGPPIPTILQEGISESDMRQYADSVRSLVNKVLAFLGVLASGKDLRLNSLIASGAYGAARLFARISPLTLAFLVFAAAFSLPKLYEAKQEEIDMALKKVQDKLQDGRKKFDDAVLSKIPKAKAAKADAKSD